MINMYEPEKMSEDELMKLAYKRHQEVFEKWKYGKPVKAWKENGCQICVQYECGKWFHYKDFELTFPTFW